ncbi:tyrosine-type recombinase/integrase [Zhihengliuella halotolerans]|uniref:tyrosine-type recombinase/integrase n=1 Tax=Zhihengliuella halotolerans TaxID=370736 RepID=UPI000C7FD6DE|nr:site-specific integrase [Zhihengliuella halotolerans]
MASIRLSTLKDGTLVHRVLWRDRDARKQTSFTAASESEAELVRRLLDANGQSFTLANKAMAEARSLTPQLERVLTAYLADLTGIEPDTKRRYEAMIRRHIAPTLGTTKLEFLDRAAVIAWFDSLDLAPKTKKNVHALLSSALAWAVEAGHLDDNPAKGIAVPRGTMTRRRATFLTHDEYRILDSHLPEKFRLFCRLLVNSGARFGEATALTKEDFQLLDSGHFAVDITKAWKTTPNGWRIGAPKSQASIRTIMLPKTMTDSFVTWVSPLKMTALVFTNQLGGQLTNGTFYNGTWKPAIDRATDENLTDRLLKTPRVHDLRHTHASWLIAAGVPLPTIQARLGHTSISTTIEVYGHLALDADRIAADALA